MEPESAAISEGRRQPGQVADVLAAMSAMDGRLADATDAVLAVARELAAARSPVNVAVGLADLDGLIAAVADAATTAGLQVAALLALALRATYQDGWDAREKAYEAERAAVAVPRQLRAV